MHWLSLHGAIRGFSKLLARRGDPQGRLIADPAVRATPVPFMDEVRATGPIVKCRTVYLTVDYQIANDLLRSDDFHVLAMGSNLPKPLRWVANRTKTDLLHPLQPPSMLSVEPPDHTRYRKLLNVAFLPRTVQRLQSRIEEVAEALIDELSGRREADLVPALAVALPIRIIAELLGVPAEHEGYFRELGNGMLSLDAEAQRTSMVAMFVFLHELLERKRKEPADDILSYWVTAAGDDGAPMDEQELIGLAMVVLVGGYDTTVGMIGTMLLGLLAEPERIDGVRDDPRRLSAAVEEFLRLYGTVHTGIRRFAAADLEVGGELIRAGDTVLLSLAAADRDPRQFPAPDVADFDRPNAAAHLAFGRGVHVCPGNALARAEIGLYQTLHRLGARVRTSHIVRRYLHA